MSPLNQSILSDARSHACMAAACMAPVGWFAGTGGMTILAVSAALVFAVTAISRRMVSLAAPGEGSPVFAMVAGAASRMLLVAGLIAFGFQGHLLGLPEQDVRLLGLLTIPFYLLQLVLEIQSAQKVFEPRPVGPSVHSAC